MASSQRLGYPDDYLVDYEFETETTWCTQTSNEHFPTIDITFTEPVLITGILSGGYSYTFSGNIDYVNNFTVEYFSSLEGSGGPMASPMNNRIQTHSCYAHRFRTNVVEH